MRQAPEITHEARLMRQSTTQAEARLWQRLRARRLDGWKVRREHPLGRRIVSFYAAGARLAIQVTDRFEPLDDLAAELAERRISLPRLYPEDVLHDPGPALYAIRQCLAKRRSASLTP